MTFHLEVKTPHILYHNEHLCQLDAFSSFPTMQLPVTWDKEYNTATPWTKLIMVFFNCTQSDDFKNCEVMRLFILNMFC